VPEKPIDTVRIILAGADSKNPDALLRNSIVKYCEQLFHSIGLQTSVKKYQASGEERGAVLDFIDHPLNNRWWIEDQLKAIQLLPAEKQTAALIALGSWENPAPGSLYDAVGNIAASPHVLKGESWQTDPLADGPGYDWWDNGFSRQRLSFMSNLRWPLGLVYNGLDSTGSYKVRITGYGECFLKINGVRVAPTIYGKGIGEIKEFPVPQELLKTGKINLSFEDINEDQINWRQQSRVTEVWLIPTSR